MALKIGRFQPPHCQLTLPHARTVANIRMNQLGSLRYDMIWCWHNGSIFFQISTVISERRIICAVKCGTTVQCHPRSLILGPIERACKTSYCWLIVTLPYLAPFLRYSDLLVENSQFSIPLSHSAPFRISGKPLQILVAESFADMTVKVSWF